MGCGCFGGKGGYESPAIGTYVWGLVLQLTAGTLMLLVGDGSFGYDAFFNAIERPSEVDNRAKVMTAMGSIHVALVVIMAAILMAGFFISECFLLPLCILSVLQMVYCIVSSGVCGYYWDFENGQRKSALLLDKISKDNQIPVPPIFPDTIDMDAGIIYLAAILTLGCLVPYSRASSIDEDTPPPEVAMYVPTLTMSTCLGALLLIGAPNLTDTRTMGIIWFLIAFGLGLVINLSRCFCCPRFFNIIVGLCFAGVAAAAVICGSYYAYWYGVGRYVWLGLWTQNIALEDDYFEPFFIYMYLNLGTALVGAFILSMAIATFSIFSCVYALRSVLCCCGKTSKKGEKPAATAPAEPADNPA